MGDTYTWAYEASGIGVVAQQYAYVLLVHHLPRGDQVSPMETAQYQHPLRLCILS